MNKRIILKIPASLREYAERELANRGVQHQRLTDPSAVRFGMRLGPVEASSEELIELIEAGPQLVDALFETIQRLKANTEVIVDDHQVRNPTRQQLQSLLLPGITHRPTTFERFRR